MKKYVWMSSAAVVIGALRVSSDATAGGVWTGFLLFAIKIPMQTKKEKKESTEQLEMGLPKW